MFFERDNKYLIAVPGVPHEMRHLLSEKMHDHLPAGDPVEHRFIRTAGEGETVIAEMIGDIEEELPAGIKLAYLPSFSQVTLRLSAYGTSQKEVIEEFEERITARLGPLVFGSGMTTLSKSVGDMLRLRGETIATAESCTGGYLSHLLTSVPGSSDYFIGSVVPYAYRMKTSELDISEETLLKYGAVSEEVVTAMAECVREKLNVTWSLASSGIAGPTGGTVDKPVGMIWIACSGPNGTKARLLRLSRDRISNIEYTSISALVLLRKCILGLDGES
jgi:nicotinamide-nucleotide amidase